MRHDGRRAPWPPPPRPPISPATRARVAAEVDADRADEVELDDLEVDEALRRVLLGALLSLDNGQRPRAVARRIADAVRRYR